MSFLRRQESIATLNVIFMKNIFKNILLYILGILFLYVAFFVVSVVPSILFSPFLIYEFIKNPHSWSEISFYYQIIIILGTLIFLGIIVLEINKLIKYIRKE